MAAREGATLVCLQELTLSPYFATSPDGPAAAGAMPEEIPDGPTCRFAAALARETGAHVHASLYERAEAPDVLGFNTAGGAGPRRVAGRPHAQDAHPGRRRLPRGSLLPPGAGGRRHAGRRGGEGRFGFPTCWDQWFPELARAYSLAGAEVLVYPTAIGSEPDLPDFDTEPLWEQVMIANGIANGTFMIAVNRIGEEPPGGAAVGHVAGAAVAPTRVTFYGSLFISDPYGRKLVQAPRDEPAVLVADLDLDQRRDWLALTGRWRQRPPATGRSRRSTGVKLEACVELPTR